MPKSIDNRDAKALEILGAISRIVQDKVLPTALADSGDGSDASPSLDKAKKLTVADVLAPNSPYRKVDSETGLDFIDTSGLHISQMDKEDVRKELKARIDELKGLRGELASLADTMEKKILSKGPLNVKVDTKRDVNLRRAISRTYGKKSNIITFQQYKKAIALRRKIRKQEVESASGREMGKPHDKKA